MSASNMSFNEFKDVELNSLEKLERQLKVLWSQYIYCLDRYGLNETTRELKQKNLNWKMKWVAN